MLRRSVAKLAVSARARAPAVRSFAAPAGRMFEYFEDVEVKENVAIVRLNGPNKMNTINEGMQADVEKIFREHILNNPEVKAVVFISSKPDNFIAGADIDMIKVCSVV